jgi:hypothetical protein
MKISELQNEQVVNTRIGRAGRNGVRWQKWEQKPLFVQRNKKGKVVIVSLMNSFWAEYCPEFDYSNGTFIAEDYYMQIEGLDKEE